MATAGKQKRGKGGREKNAGFAQIAERHRRRGSLERAVEVCERGLKEYPEHLSGRVTLGWALLDLGRYSAAQDELEAVLKRAPDNLTAIRGLAELHDRAESTLPLDMDPPEGWPTADDDSDGLDVAAPGQPPEAGATDATGDGEGLPDLIDSAAPESAAPTPGEATVADIAAPDLVSSTEATMAEGVSPPGEVADASGVTNADADLDAALADVPAATNVGDLEAALTSLETESAESRLSEPGPSSPEELPAPEVLPASEEASVDPEVEEAVEAFAFVASADEPEPAPQDLGGSEASDDASGLADLASDLAASQEAEPLPDVATIQEAEPLPDVAVIQEVEALPDVATIEEAESLPDVAVIQEVEALPDVAAIQEADPLPDVAAIQEADPLPDVEVIQDAQPLPDPEMSAADAEEPADRRADPAGSGLAALSDAAVAFADAADESRDAALAAAASPSPTDPDAAEPQMLAEAAHLVDGQADAEALAGDLAAFAAIAPDSTEPSVGSGSDQSGADGDETAAENLVAFAASTPAEDVAEAGAESHHLASAEAEPDGSDLDLPLADLDSPLVAAASDAPDFDDAVTQFQSGRHEESAGDGPHFDASTELLEAADVSALHEYVVPEVDHGPAADPDQAFDAARDAADVMAAGSDSDHEDLVAEIAAASAVDAAEAAEAAEAFGPADLPAELVSSAEDWTPPAQATVLPGTLAEDQELVSARPYVADDVEQAGDELVSELAAGVAQWTSPLVDDPEPAPTESSAGDPGFQLPDEFGAKAMARMDMPETPAAPVADQTATAGDTEGLAQTPLHRLEQMLARVQARRLRRAVESVA